MHIHHKIGPYGVEISMVIECCQKKMVTTFFFLPKLGKTLTYIYILWLIISLNGHQEGVKFRKKGEWDVMDTCKFQ